MSDGSTLTGHKAWFDGAAPPSLESRRLELRGLRAEDAPGVPAAAADRIGLHVTA